MLEEALKYYEKSAKLGDTESYFEMGMIYGQDSPLELRSGDPNRTKALEYYEKSAKLGNAEAYEVLAKIYWNASGVSRDVKRALAYYHKAIDMGSVDAYLELAKICRSGVREREYVGNAEDYYKKAIQIGKTKLGRADICARIARTYLSYCTDKLKDRPKATAYLQRVADLSRGVLGMRASRWLAFSGWRYGDGFVLKWYLKAIELGDTSLYGCVAKMYAEGRGCVQDDKKP
ncbi:hypothetical protein NHP190012_08260 [Helicobacter sp. NHP19-012]|uniref:beta-lactamase n=1 Tax=Helicobacter gastrofelis TaxID=2849642 RepID=A0ABN6I955_9HELI|nr:tetratricopeptide repeat protein [Helicobacter sp. NHP19-012]BCZ19184.1 hypothetical protein NHP190012_08260 [Helicobacter sp. NHP19-012]